MGLFGKGEGDLKFSNERLIMEIVMKEEYHNTNCLPFISMHNHSCLGPRALLSPKDRQLPLIRINKTKFKKKRKGFHYDNRSIIVTPLHMPNV